MLAEAAVKGVYAPGERPFFSKWAEGSPEEVSRTVVQRQWRKRGAWIPEHWALELAVFEGGQPIGTQEVRAKDFAALREVESASWLGVEYLAFAGLGAAYALSASFVDNASSAAISRKLGYQPDGIQRDANDGEVLVTQRFRLSRAQWEAAERPTVSVTGLEPCLGLFGVSQKAENELGQERTQR